jgi:SAM-dependent methyltransferase
LDHGLSANDTVVDFGTGTGVTALALAAHCDRVVAVDVSQPMLDIVREKAETEGADNVEVVHDGLVRYDHEGSPAGFAFSRNALHHLPDFWKVGALKSVGDALEPGGIFRLHDLATRSTPPTATSASRSGSGGWRGRCSRGRNRTPTSGRSSTRTTS